MGPVRIFDNVHVLSGGFYPASTWHCCLCFFSSVSHTPVILEENTKFLGATYEARPF